jgi:hypothetical protein
MNALVVSVFSVIWLVGATTGNEGMANGTCLYSFEDMEMVYVVVISTLVLNAMVCLVISNLVIFHVWLRYHHLTTYQYIIQRRRMKRA